MEIIRANTRVGEQKGVYVKKHCKVIVYCISSTAVFDPVNLNERANLIGVDT